MQWLCSIPDGRSPRSGQQTWKSPWRRLTSYRWHARPSGGWPRFRRPRSDRSVGLLPLIQAAIYDVADPDGAGSEIA
jgi:hypothetical protein